MLILLLEIMFKRTPSGPAPRKQSRYYSASRAMLRENMERPDLLIGSTRNSCRPYPREVGSNFPKDQNSAFRTLSRFFEEDLKIR